MKKAIERVYQQALTQGHLIYTPTQLVQLPLTQYASEASFQVRLIASLARKPTPAPISDATKNQPKINPFLPHDPNLEVVNGYGHVDGGGEYHVVLNKFCVVPMHCLLITREFVPQEQRLIQRDFEVVHQFFRDVSADSDVVEKTEEKWLCFFNCGPLSGASQPHKHLQLVPVSEIPVEYLVKENKLSEVFKGIRYAWSKISGPSDAYETYLRLLQNIDYGDGESYNMLMTKEWLMVVKRSRETSSDNNGLSVNALGYAGMILVKNESQMPKTAQRVLDILIECASF